MTKLRRHVYTLTCTIGLIAFLTGFIFLMKFFPHFFEYIAMAFIFGVAYIGIYQIVTGD